MEKSEDIKPLNIEAELNRIREDKEQKNKIRASLFNLIVFVSYQRPNNEKVIINISPVCKKKIAPGSIMSFEITSQDGHRFTFSRLIEEGILTAPNPKGKGFLIHRPLLTNKLV